ncbi:hypothetical protein [Methylobacterium sp. WL9]|uniref:hypothetical protein n=1 Tax=Methylobacterium sp. WL9 TaxID=2603898 RepID=UPI001EDD7C00|nr:hypothetical protein [Methylobacterium sp. WL9]
MGTGWSDSALEPPNRCNRTAYGCRAKLQQRRSCIISRRSRCGSKPIRHFCENVDSVESGAIDIIYRWINPEIGLAKQRQIIANEPIYYIGGTNCINRYRDNHELKYSLRSVAEYAEWARAIYIIGEGPPPNWLLIRHPIVWIDLDELLEANSLKPQPNSELQKLCFAKIDGLAERFICFDDDWFLGRKVAASDFFTAEGKPIHPHRDHTPIAWTKSLYEKGLTMLPQGFVDLVKLAGTARHDVVLKMREIMVAEDLVTTSSERDAQFWLRDVNVGHYQDVLRQIEEAQPKTYCINDDWSSDEAEYAEQMNFLQLFFERILPNPASWERHNDEPSELC